MRNLGIVLAIFLGSVSYAQSPVPASIEGIVVRSDNGDGLSGATVELRTEWGAPLTTTTGADGKFSITNIRPDQYRILATLSGYVRAEYNPQRSISPAPHTLSPGQRMTGIRINMVPGGVITGHVTKHGQPAADVIVVAVKESYEGGQRVWSRVLSTQTDDLGEYHIFWLPTGRYYVMVEGSDLQTLPPPTLFINPGGQDNPLISRGPTMGTTNRNCRCGPDPNPFLFTVSPNLLGVVNDAEMTSPIFFPNKADWRESTPIDVKPGSEIAGINIDISPVPALHVRGTVVGMPATQAGPSATTRVQLSLFSANPTAGYRYADVQSTSSASYAQVQPNANGAFDIPRVKPGSYVLRATAPNMNAAVEFEVYDRDVSGLDLTLSPSTLINGTVRFEPNTGRGLDSVLGNLTLQVFMERLDRSTVANFRIKPDGSFTIPLWSGNNRMALAPLLISHWETDSGSAQYMAGRKSLGLETAYVKSMTFEGVDVLNNGLDSPRSIQSNSQMQIVIGTDGAGVNGRVLDERKQGLIGATIVLIPTNHTRFHYVHDVVSSDASGYFELKGIAPGDYKLFAWDNVEKGAWQNQAFMQMYEEQGTPVHVNAGDKKSIELSAF